MIVLFIMRSALQPCQDGFETGIVAAIHRNAPERFHEGREQSRGFRRLLHIQGLHSAATGTHHTSGPRKTADFSRGGSSSQNLSISCSRWVSVAQVTASDERCC